ncbi:hypothetical protein FKM82_028285 [Ascaphus truei]
MGWIDFSNSKGLSVIMIPRSFRGCRIARKWENQAQYPRLTHTIIFFTLFPFTFSLRLSFSNHPSAEKGITLSASLYIISLCVSRTRSTVVIVQRNPSYTGYMCLRAYACSLSHPCIFNSFASNT